jgi:hypothetical protein
MSENYKRIKIEMEESWRPLRKKKGDRMKMLKQATK